jgi:hypothetical protein
MSRLLFAAGLLLVAFCAASEPASAASFDGTYGGTVTSYAARCNWRPGPSAYTYDDKISVLGNKFSWNVDGGRGRSADIHPDGSFDAVVSTGRNPMLLSGKIDGDTLLATVKGNTCKSTIEMHRSQG